MRFMNAYIDRIYKNSELKHHFYVKAMPIDDVRSIKPESLENIIKRTKDLNYLKNKEILPDSYIIDVVDDFYKRNQNRLIFDKHVRENVDNFVEKNELFLNDSDETNKSAPKKGLIKLQRNAFEVKSSDAKFTYPPSLKFEETFKLFCINSIFTKNPVLNIIKELQNINLKIS